MATQRREEVLVPPGAIRDRDRIAATGRRAEMYTLCNVRSSASFNVDRLFEEKIGPVFRGRLGGTCCFQLEAAARKNVGGGGRLSHLS